MRPMLSLLRLALLTMVLAAGTASAQEKRVILKGHDPVAYFTEGRPVKGSPAFAYDWDGDRYYFASAANRDDTKTATATCSTGVAVGGGVLFAGDSPENLTTTANYPSDASTWTVEGAEASAYSNNGNWSIQAFVICAS